MAKKKVFVSFDWDHDKHYKFLLEAWDANPEFDFNFSDQTPGEINTNNIDRIKAGLTAKINASTYTLFIVGQYANQLHKDRNLIGFDNWINFEANKSVSAKNHLAVIKIDKSNVVPKQLEGAHYWHATGFNQNNVIALLNKAAE